MLFSCLFAQTFRFFNDALTWGFVPEWDDWETNLFSFSADIGRWDASLEYGILTDRDRETADSSRLDFIAFSGAYNFSFWKDSLVDFDLRTGLSAKIFGDFYGYEVQTGWHKNVEIHREVPTEYDSSFTEFSIPVHGTFSLPGSISPHLIIEQTVYYPWSYSGFAGVGISIDESLIPLTLDFGYAYLMGESGNKTHDAVKEKRTGFRLASSFDFWPLVAEKEIYFNSLWGTGSMGIDFEKPDNPPPENALLELQLIGFSHLANGIKVMKQFIVNEPLRFIYSGFYYKALSGWADSTLTYPEDMRFSEIDLGFEEGVSFPLGGFRSDIYIQAGTGISQDQFYVLKSTVLEPVYVKNSWTFLWGGGIRFFIPFFHQRKLGVAFEVYRKDDLLSWGDWQDSQASDNPWNYMLSLVVSH